MCAALQYHINWAKVGTVCLGKVLRIVTLSVGIATLKNNQKQGIVARQSMSGMLISLG